VLVEGLAAGGETEGLIADGETEGLALLIADGEALEPIIGPLSGAADQTPLSWP
jgi:hypothetical protein